jgi:hypothetical protein
MTAPPHLAKLKDVRNRDNALILAQSWGEHAITSTGFADKSPEEIGYEARCAAHFYNLLQNRRLPA